MLLKGASHFGSESGGADGARSIIWLKKKKTVTALTTSGYLNMYNELQELLTVGYVRRLACRGSMGMLGAHRICWVDWI